MNNYIIKHLFFQRIYLLTVRGGEGGPWLQRRQELPQDRLAQLRHVGDFLRGFSGAAREPARRGRQGLLPNDAGH